MTLVDTQGKGVERITEKGVVANGKEYEIDCLIYATGFEVGTSYTRRSGYELYGRGGQSLTDKWKDGVSTLHGMSMRAASRTASSSATRSRASPRTSRTCSTSSASTSPTS